MAKPLTLPTQNAQAPAMPGIPFRSTLAPYMEYIRARRRAGATWREIAEALGKQGVTASPSNICEVFRRTQARKKWPAGLEPMAQASSPAADPGEGQETDDSPTFRRVKRKVSPTAAPAQDGLPKPFRSRLNPHLAFIQAQRQAGQSWRQIADDLAGRGVRVSFQAVADFYSRTSAREAKRIAETQPPATPQEDARTPVAVPARTTPQQSGKARPGDAEGNFAGLE